MSDINTRHYAIPPDFYFWRWSNDGSAFEWSNGDTLAFTQEIFAILQSLADQGGIPPLSSLLLVHAATSGQADRFTKASDLLIKSHPNEFASGESKTLLNAVSHSLSKIADLPIDLKSGTNAKAQLCHALFNRSTWSHQDERARLITQALLTEAPPLWLDERPPVSFAQRFLRDTSVLIKATAGLDAPTLEHLVRTGLEFTNLSAAPFDETLTEETDDSRSLIEQLAGSGQDLSALASVAKQVIGLIALPLPASQKADLPIGGVADIVNRGTPDKLLTSELAWGDDILALRLAQNEALFYHRETPPENTPSERIILLDHGLRYWGLLRLFALATHLGLRCYQASAKHLEVTNLIATPTACTPFLLDTPTHVRTALVNLPTHLSLAPALADLTNQITHPDTPKSVSDIFLISTPTSLKDSETETNLHQLTTAVRHAGGRLYLIEIIPTGHLTISELRARRKRKLQDGVLDLDKLLLQKRDTPKRQTPKAKLTNTSLEKLTGSKFYNHYPPPILLPAVPAYNTGFHPGGNKEIFIGLCQDSHVMKWARLPDRAEELSQKIPDSQIHWIGENDEGRIQVAVPGKKAGDSARVFGVEENGSIVEIPTERTKHTFPRRALFQSEFVIFIYSDFAEAFSLQTGKCIASRSSDTPDLHNKTLKIVDGEIAISIVPSNTDSRKIYEDLQAKVGSAVKSETLVPNQIGFTKDGGFYIRPKNGCYRLNKMGFAWESVPLPHGKFHTLMNFEETSAKRFPTEKPLQQVKAPLGPIFTFDPRGLLHLTNGSISWTITLNQTPILSWKSTSPDESYTATIVDFFTFLKNLHQTLNP